MLNKKVFHINLFVPIVCVTLFCSCLFRPSARLAAYSDYRFKNNPTNILKKGQVKITYLGVATLLIDDGETQILTDGFVTRPSLFKVGFKKIGSDTALVRSVAKKLQMTRLKAIFTAHSHYDHAIDAPYFAKFTNAKLYGSESTLNIGRGAGLQEDRMKVYEPGHSEIIGKFKVTVVESKHTPPLSFPKEENEGKIISGPLKQPAKRHDFVEGGAYDFLIELGEHAIYIKASTNYIEHTLDSVKADLLFLGIATLSKQDTAFQRKYYLNTVGSLKPGLVIPIHWDNFFKPLSKDLVPYPTIADNVKRDFDFLIEKTRRDKIELKLMQGYENVVVFPEN